MATNWLVRRTVDLARPHTSNDVINCGYIYRDDNAAHVWEVTILRDGEPADMTGYTVRGYFIRSDETTVSITGSKSGNVATVQLNASCYALKGLLKGVVRLEKTGEVITVSAMHVRVDVATTDEMAIDQETRISIQDMLEDVEAMLADTGNYYTKSETQALAQQFGEEIAETYIANGTTDDVSLGGNLALKADGLLKVIRVEPFNSVSIAANTNKSSTYAITSSDIGAGWTPVGVVGYSTGQGTFNIYRLRLAVNDANTLEYSVRNIDSSANKGSLGVSILCIRTSL